MKDRKAISIPHTFVILISITLVVSLLSYVIPSGEYDFLEVGERTILKADSFHSVQDRRVDIMQILTSVIRGMKQSAEIIFFIFILGGSFGIINKTGVMEVGVNNLAVLLEGRRKLLIPVITTIFSILGATVGLSEETIIFIPMGIALARGLGYDKFVGTAMIFLGASVGFISGFMNSFTVGIAQQIAGLPTFSGMMMRIIIWIIFLAITIVYIQRYADSIYSLDRSTTTDNIQKIDNIEKIRPVHKLIIFVFISSIAVLIYGVFSLGWYIEQISGLFIAVAILSGIIAKINPSDMADSFIEGAKDITMGALIVGVARSILVVMNDGGILYTVINYIAETIKLLPRQITAIGMFLLQSILNFFIPSGSGQASITMPIMTPIADITGITRQTAVLAFQLGDGISNSMIPTDGTLLAVLSVAGIDYEDWFKFIWKLLLIWTLLGCIMVWVATIIEYGPY